MDGAIDSLAVTQKCSIASFGFKYGRNHDVDWVIDARFLPNPFWVPELRPFTGLDPRVADYVLSAPGSQEFLERAVLLLNARLNGVPEDLRVGVGCTGGRHRSVAIACELAQRLGRAGVQVNLAHRDVERPDPR